MAKGFDVYFWRQLFLEIAVCLTSFTTGIAVAFPSVLNPAILGNDTEIQVTRDQASWIATCLGLGGLIGYICIPVIFQIYGRKMANIITNLSVLAGNLIMYLAYDVYSLAFGRILQGPSTGGTYITGLALCECIAPKRRGYFIVLNKVSLGLGTLACHALVFVLNWRQIALVGALANLIAIVIFYLSAESPLFLAMRGKFDESAETFEWFRGNSLNAKNELQELLSAQTENLRVKEREDDVSVTRRTFDMLKTKSFQKSFYIVTLAILCLEACGRYFTRAYITEILTELTNNTYFSMYVSVAADCILINALCISTFLIKKFNRRFLLFNCGFCSVFIMYQISALIILRSKFNILQDYKWVTPALILIHTFITNVGLTPIAHALTGEIFPLDQKGLGSFLSGIVFFTFFNIVMKVTPIMIEKTGVEGTYGIYGTFLLIFLVLLRLVLPETKDKTLQQIEDDIKGVVRNNSEVESLQNSKVYNLGN